MSEGLARRAQPPLTGVYLVDDHPLFVIGLRSLLSRELGMRICGEASNLRDAAAGLAATSPEVVVTDLSLGRESGLDLIEVARSLHKPAQVVVLSMHDESLYAETALRRGAAGYVMKSEVGTQVVQAVRAAAMGQVHVSAEMNARLLQRLGPAGDRQPGGISGLSARELEVFRLVGMGVSTAEIGQALHISPKTVESHRLNIKLKLGLSKSSELILSAANWLREVPSSIQDTRRKS